MVSLRGNDKHEEAGGGTFDSDDEQKNSTWSITAIMLTGLASRTRIVT